MTALPVVHRELVVAGRRRITYYTRCAAAALLALVGLLLLTFTGQSGPGAIGLPRLTFQILSSILLTFSLVGGILLTADSIASERREGTLGLLFLTELTGRDIVLGKLASSSIQGLCALLGALPILAIPLMMGGITAADYWFTALALLASLLASCGIGLWASTRSRSAGAGVSSALLGVIVLCILPVLLAWSARRIPGLPQFLMDLELLSPPIALARCWNIGNGFNRSVLRAVSALGLISLTGILSLAAAAWTLSHTGRGGIPESTARNQPKSSRPTQLVPVRRPSVEQAPRWLYQRRLPALGALRWIFLLGVIAWIGFYIPSRLIPGSGSAIPVFITCMFIAYGLHVTHKIRLALLATAPWVEDIRSGAMELLLSTPLHPRRLLTGQRDALRIAGRGPFWTLTLMNGGLLASIPDPDLGISGGDVAPFVALFAGGIACLVVDSHSIPRIAAFHVLRGHPLGAAMTRTLLPILIPPWIGALLVFLVSTAGPTSSGGMGMLFILIQAMQCALSAYLGYTASRQGILRFRTWMSLPPVRSRA
jgi:ABC-type transport system involved in multi-copper enzyme maturation permease subunit